MSKPAATRNLTPRTPGAAPATTGDLTQDERAALAAQAEDEAAALEASLLSGETEVTDAPAADAPAAAPVVTQDLASYIQAEIARGVAAALAAQRGHAPVGTAAAQLPDQSEVDATEIRSEVLTKQGYVVPVSYPEPPVANRVRQ